MSNDGEYPTPPTAPTVQASPAEKAAGHQAELEWLGQPSQSQWWEETGPGQV